VYSYIPKAERVGEHADFVPSWQQPWTYNWKAQEPTSDLVETSAPEESAPHDVPPVEEAPDALSMGVVTDALLESVPEEETQVTSP
jgi:hypothetical protein